MEAVVGADVFLLLLFEFLLFLFLAATIALKAMVYLLVGDVQNLAYRTTFGRLDQFLIGALKQSSKWKIIEDGDAVIATHL